MTKNRIGIIGSGATALYTLKHLLHSKKPLELTVFESSSEVGKGMPYRTDMNADYMLCNAFSKEIPPLTRTLIQWLEELPKRELSEWELSAHDISPRAFYPRLLIGEFLADEFDRLCKLARQLGHKVTIKPNERVKDIVACEGGTASIYSDKAAEPGIFDQVIIASGHSWPAKPHLDDANLLSPWPYTHVTALPPGNIGILGSSLSAIDVVIALGNSHGKFDDQGETVSWQPNQDAANLKITMFSKEGIMPEGDFYYPFPYEPLKIFSPEAVDAEITRGSKGLLQRVFDLLWRELDHSDPDYLKHLDVEGSGMEGFATAYFERRKELGGLAAVKDDFIKARKSFRARMTIPYRYVLLRAHENFDRALRILEEADWKLFTQTLLPVFTDSYAAVPHLSLSRVIAMFDAKVLELKSSGKDASFKNGPSGSVEIKFNGERLKVDVLIDARGQAAAPLDRLPFPSLVKKLAPDQQRLEAPFKLKTPTSIYCLALPQLLERYPFCQGLANSAENGKTVAEDILNNV